MKISCIFKQVLCLICLLILTCDSKRPKKEICLTGRIFKEIENLSNKTANFKKLFPDDKTDMKLLTNTLKTEFMENCSTRLHLLSFYTNDVLSEDLVLPEAQKSGIYETFLKTERDFRICTAKCQLSKSTNETEGMKEFWNKIKTITLKEKSHKAINEIDILLRWINIVVTSYSKRRVP